MKKMKMIASGLLIFMAVIFCISFYFEHALPWLRIVRAFAEASMVGAMADWFAVVVLFRHPLGIPLPHTAIIPKSKDRIGLILGDFVIKNFLTKDVIKEHFINKLDLADALSGLLVENAGILAAETALSLPQLLEYINDDDIRSIIKANILPHFHHIELAGIAGGMLEFLTHGEAFDKVSDEGLRIGRRIVRQSLPVVRRYILRELPMLWPERFGKKEVANGIAKYIVNKLKEQIDAIENDATHATRKALQRQLKRFISSLRTSPEYRKTAAQIVDNIVTNPIFSEYILNIWKELKRFLESKVQRPDREMKERIETVISGFGASIKNDVRIHRELNKIVERVLLTALPHFAPAIQRMIEKTVGGWTEKQIVSTLEPAVGRDLQFIRINGALVGGLVGLIINALSLVLPH